MFLSYLKESQEAINFYYTVEDQRTGIKFSFALIYIIIVTLLLFLSITIAIRFSSRFFISINNIFFGTLIFSIMLGVIYPLIYEYLYDQKISVGAPFYNAIFIPIVILAAIFLFFSIDSKWSRVINLKFFSKPISLSLLFSLAVTLLIFINIEKYKYQKK